MTLDTELVPGTEVRVAQRGQITLPKAFRDAYAIREGDVLTVVDIGDALVLAVGRTGIDRIADELAAELAARGETLESMLDAVREARERYDTDPDPKPDPEPER